MSVAGSLPDKSTSRDGWWQCVYGKLIQEPDGPIVKRLEHCQTGHSASLPVGRWCYPQEVGIGTGDQSDWGQFPWAQPRHPENRYAIGGIVLRPICADGAWYVVAGRIRGRSEAGEGKPGRYYTQAHYLVREVAAIDHRALLELPDFLRTEPQLEIEPEMPCVVVTEQSERQLPKHWFDTVRDLLTYVLCGEPVAVEDTNLHPDAFYEQAMICLACLPGALRWRLPIGCGLYSIRSDEIVLGHGASASPGVARKTDAGWRDDEDVKAKAPAITDPYFYWLADITRDVQTIGQLSRRIDEELAHLASWDALPIAAEQPLDWRQDMRTVLAHAKDVSRLQVMRDWLETNRNEPPPQIDAEFLRPQIVRLIGEHLRPPHRGLDLLTRASAWQQAWQAVAGESNCSDDVRAVAMLLGHVEFQIEDVERAKDIDFPVTLFQRTTHCLSEAFGEAIVKSDDRTWRRWCQFAERCARKDSLGWLKDWSNKISHDEPHLRIFQWAVSQCVAEGVEHDCAYDHRLPNIVKTMLREKKLPVPARFRNLLDSIGDPVDDSDKALSQAKMRILNAADVIASRFREMQYTVWLLVRRRCVGGGKATHEVFQLTQGELQRVVSSVANFVSHFKDTPCLRDDISFLQNLLLDLWHQDAAWTVQSRNEVKPFLATKLGDPYAGVFFGDTSAGYARSKADEVARAVLTQAMSTSPGVIDRALNYLGHHPDDVDFAAMIFEWLKTRPINQLQTHPVLNFVRELTTGSCRRLPEFTWRQASIAGALLKAQPVVSLPADVGNLAQLRAYLAVAMPQNDPPRLRPDLMAELIQFSVVEDERRSFSDHLKRLNTSSLSGWRLASPAPPKGKRFYESYEIDVLKQLANRSPTCLLHLYLGGWPLPEQLLDQLDQFFNYETFDSYENPDQEPRKLSIPQIDKLMKLCRDKKMTWYTTSPPSRIPRKIARDLVKYLVAKLIRPLQNASDVQHRYIVALTTKNKWWTRWLPSDPPERQNLDVQKSSEICDFIWSQPQPDTQKEFIDGCVQEVNRPLPRVAHPSVDSEQQVVVVEESANVIDVSDEKGASTNHGQRENLRHRSVEPPADPEPPPKQPPIPPPRER